MVKSEYAKAKVTVLEHVMGQSRALPREGKVQVIKDMPVAKTKWELLRFFGMCGFYRKFILSFSAVIAPLTNLKI